MSERYQSWLANTVIVEACIGSYREQWLINVKLPMMGRVENNKTTLVAGGHEIRVFEGIYPCHPTASRGPNAE